MVTNAAAGNFDGPVVQVGAVHGDIHINSGRPARSHYLALVERIAPPQLVDRSDELAELTHFCTSPTTEGQYSWWMADAGSGKSALLSTFVLAPPPGVTVVSFFVTASLAEHSDRSAFVDNLLEQLYALLKQPEPWRLPASTRETHMLGVLADVARRCQTHGEQFVLVVDGLDEDRGVDGTPDARSIAALLPVTPPAGMRVIVSGRPNPPVPTDVPAHHPLRDPAIIRPLARYAHADVIRDIQERDLKRLMYGTNVEQDMLGFLVAAGGGLTTRDLAELINTSQWQIEDRLRTANGRSFVSQASDRPEQFLDVLMLAHGQLQSTAEAMLEARLDGYRNRIHAWADRYASRRWPADSPDYLFHSYFALLAIRRDVERMIACATDPHRRRHLRARTSSDGAALVEITRTQELLLSDDQPDLVGLARLAVHRDHLYWANSRMPTELPAGWARVGQFDRCESMIDAIREPADRINALVIAVCVCRAIGQPQRATKMLDQAEDEAASFNQFWGAGPISSVAREFARAGKHEHAQQAAALIGEPTERAETLAWLARQAATDNDIDRARRYLSDADTLIRADERSWRDRALAVMAVATADTGDLVRATTLLDEAEAVLRDERSNFRPSKAASLAECAASMGESDRMLRVIQLIDDENKRESTLLAILWDTAAHDPDRAEQIARATADPARLCPRLATVSTAIRKRRPDHAERLLTEADTIGRQISDERTRYTALMTTAEALADRGDTNRAAEISRDYAATDADNANLVLDVAAATLRNGDLELGAELLTLTERMARRAAGDRDEHLSVLWIRTMADMRDFDRARQLAASLTIRTAREAAWSAIAEGALAAQALDLAEYALAAINEPSLQRRPRLDLVRALLANGDPARATAIARETPNLEHRAAALLLIAHAQRGVVLLDEAAHIAGTIAEPDQRMTLLLNCIETAATLGLREQTTQLLNRLKPTAQLIHDNKQDFRTAHYKAERAIELCSAHIRTMTEVAETAAYLQSKHVTPSSDPFSKVIPPRYFPRKKPDIPPEKDLAYELTILDWRHSVGDLVRNCPSAYHAIIEELDTIDQPRQPEWNKST